MTSAVLTDISLEVAKGEVMGLLGPNGAGKTTCFYSIMGLVRPDQGAFCWMAWILPRCPCIAAPCWGWAICRRKPRSSAG
jgi:ABC-type lipopolysaccharide export system ATPase subunit